MVRAGVGKVFAAHNALAKVLTPISEMAALLDLNEDMLRLAINDKSSPVRRVYLKAKAETAHKLRKQEIELAEVGIALKSTEGSGFT